jgi:hypothetical protein
MTAMTVKQLEDFGRTRLSKTFYMREFLYSEISQVHGIANVPDDPGLAIAAGRALCENVLEPIQERLGRISVRSAYRSVAVNAKGAENHNQYNCAADNSASHTWDRKERGFMGATACIVVTSFVPYYERTGDWTALAWWIHEHVPTYADMQFFKNLAAFNIRWFEEPGYKQSISTHVVNPHTGDKKSLVRNGVPTIEGPYERFYGPYLAALGKTVGG